MEVLGFQGRGGSKSLEVPVQNWHNAAFAYSLGWNKSQAGFQRREKDFPFSGRRPEVASPRARLQDKGARKTAAMFANSLSHSRCSAGPWKLPCEGELQTSFLR